MDTRPGKIWDSEVVVARVSSSLSAFYSQSRETSSCWYLLIWASQRVSVWSLYSSNPAPLSIHTRMGLLKRCCSWLILRDLLASWISCCAYHARSCIITHTVRIVIRTKKHVLLTQLCTFIVWLTLQTCYCLLESCSQHWGSISNEPKMMTTLLTHLVFFLEYIKS